MSSMDLDAISKAMEQLNAMKESIAKLQRQKDDAEKSVQAAKASIKSSKKESAEGSNYSDQGYWEDRYVNISGEPTKKTAIYEWYASYEDIEKYIKDDVRCISSDPSSVDILVSGVGNSSLCEDLHRSGMTKASGMDYSASAVTLMQKRATSLNLPGIHYFQADARGMPEVESCKYDVVLDKGTLDAIATEGATVGNQQVSVDAINYMLEIWRILKVGGLLVLISTMPPEILEPMAITPLSQQQSSSVTTANKQSAVAVSNWKAGCRVQPITTAEGGTVYYYTIKKLADTARVTTFRAGASTDTAGANASASASAATSNGSGAQAPKEDVMAGIAAMLEIAREATEQAQAASKKQEQAAREVAEVENKRSALEKTLQTGIQDMGESEGQELLAGAGGAKTSAGSKSSTEAHIQAAIETAVKKLAPEVKVFLDTERSSLAAGDTLDVYYLLRLPADKSTAALTGAQLLERVWQEEDTVCLVARAGLAPSGAAAVDAALYRDGDLPYEAFEYTEKPTLLSASDASTNAAEIVETLHRLGAADMVAQSIAAGKTHHHCFLGKVRIRLPVHGGAFHVSYIRTATLPADAVTLHSSGSTGKVVERRIKLAESSAFASKVPVLGAHPDARSPAMQVLFPSPMPDTRPSVPNVRRRGAGPLTNSAHISGAAASSATSTNSNELSMWIEDMPHIKTLNVITALLPADLRSSSGTSRCITRAMAWAVPALSSGSAAASSLRLYVEVDITTHSADTTSRCDGAEVHTVYGILECCDEVFRSASVDLRPAHGQVDELGRFVMRLPYSYHVDAAALKPAADSSHLAFHALGELLSQAPSQHPDLQVQCNLCKANILQLKSIENVRPLPSGLLDEMMHDFICCNLPVDSSMETTAMTTPLHTLMHGTLYASVHPDHLLPVAVRLDCKAHSTMLDISTSWGRAIATRGIAALKDTIGKGCAQLDKAREKELRQEYLRKMRSAVNIETCAIRCKRCDNYLGDGYLEADGSADAAAAVPSAPAAGSAAPFNMADVRDVRFALQNVTFCAADGRTASSGQLCMSFEQMVTRTFKQLSEGHGFNSLCLFVGDADLEILDRTGALECQCIVLKLISKSFRVSSAYKPSSMDDPSALSSSAPVQEPMRVVMQDGIKVAFRCGEVLDVLTGSEPRVPIHYHELMQLKTLLEERATRMGPSPLKGHKLSYILK